MFRKGRVYIHKASLNSDREWVWVATDRHLLKTLLHFHFFLKICEEFTYLATAHQTGILQC